MPIKISNKRFDNARIRILPIGSTVVTLDDSSNPCVMMAEDGKALQGCVAPYVISCAGASDRTGCLELNGEFDVMLGNEVIANDVTMAGMVEMFANHPTLEVGYCRSTQQSATWMQTYAQNEADDFSQIMGSGFGCPIDSPEFATIRFFEDVMLSPEDVQTPVPTDLYLSLRAVNGTPHVILPPDFSEVTNIPTTVGEYALHQELTFPECTVKVSYGTDIYQAVDSQLTRRVCKVEVIPIIPEGESTPEFYAFVSGNGVAITDREHDVRQINVPESDFGMFELAYRFCIGPFGPIDQGVP